MDSVIARFLRIFSVRNFFVDAILICYLCFTIFYCYIFEFFIIYKVDEMLRHLDFVQLLDVIERCRYILYHTLPVA